jgi:hypothetical protein
MKNTGTPYGDQSISASKTSPGCTVTAESGAKVGSISTGGAWYTIDGLIADIGSRHGTGWNVSGDHITMKNFKLWGPYVSVGGGGSNITWQGGEHGQPGVTPGKRLFADTACPTAPDSDPFLLDSASNWVIDGVTFGPNDADKSFPSCSHMENIWIGQSVNNVTIKNSVFKSGDQSGTSRIFITCSGTCVRPTNITIFNNFFGTQSSGYTIQVRAGSVDNCSGYLVAYNTFLGGDNSQSTACGSSGYTWVGNLSNFVGQCRGTYIDNVWVRNTNPGCSASDKWVQDSNVCVSCSNPHTSMGIVNDATDDLHLLSSSPAIDSGESTYCASLGNGDIDGGTRPTGTICDAGADEFGATAPSPNDANLFVNTTAGASPTRCAVACPYDSTKAYGSLNAAYQAASPGDKIRVQGGTYAAQSLAWKASAASPAVDIQPVAGATVNLASLNISGSWVSFKNFAQLGVGASGLTIGNSAANLSTIPTDITVDGGSGYSVVDGQSATQPVFYFRGAQNVTLKKLDVGNSNNNSLVMGDQNQNYGGLTNIVMDQVVFHDAHKDVGNPTHTECFFAQGIQGLTLTRSRFFRCVPQDLFITRNSTGPGPSDHIIENNIFEAPMTAGNSANSGGYSVQFFNQSPAMTVTNMVFRHNVIEGGILLTDNTLSFPVSAGSPTKLVGNIILGDQLTGTGQGGCSQSGQGVTWKSNVMVTGSCSGTNQTYASLSAIRASLTGPTGDIAGNDNYVPASGSLVIDKGDATDFPTTDLLGIARFLGVGPDAGPYEAG